MSARLFIAVLMVASVPALAGKKAPPPVVAKPAAPPPAPEVKVPTVEAREQNVVEVASGSKDHTTLVAGLKAAEYVVSLTNAGPFTVFAPTNAAFDALPKGTLETLLKPENKEALQNVLKFHVAVSVYEVKNFKPGMKLGVANGGSVVFDVKDGKVTVNGATIVATIHTSNGNIHVIDQVLVPPAKK